MMRSRHSVQTGTATSAARHAEKRPEEPVAARSDLYVDRVIARPRAAGAEGRQAKPGQRHGQPALRVGCGQIEGLRQFGLRWRWIARQVLAELSTQPEQQFTDVPRDDFVPSRQSNLTPADEKPLPALYPQTAFHDHTAPPQLDIGDRLGVDRQRQPRSRAVGFGNKRLALDLEQRPRRPHRRVAEDDLQPIGMHHQFVTAQHDRPSQPDTRADEQTDTQCQPFPIGFCQNAGEEEADARQREERGQAVHASRPECERRLAQVGAWIVHQFVQIGQNAV